MGSSTHGRLAAAATVATLAAALTLHPLITGWGWYVAVVVVAVAVAAVGAAVRQVSRSAVLVVMAQSAALVVTLTALFVRDQALFGVLPGPQALQAAGELLAQGGEVTVEQAPPVDAVRGVLLMAAAGMGLVALAVDTIAVTLRRPAVAGLPLLAVYCVPAAILPDGTSWVWFLAGALGYLALIAADGADRVRSWGRVLGDPRRSAGEPGRLALVPATGGARAAAAALALAIVVPAILPTLGSGLVGGDGLGGEGGGGGSSVSVLNPILDIRANLSERSDEPALTYTSTMARPEPLRVVVDDVFDGVTWTPSTDSIPADNRAQDGLPPPPGLDPGIAALPQTTNIQIGPTLNQNYLPLPYPATRVDVDGPWIYNANTLDVLGRGVRTQGISYEVQHLQIQPTARQLALAPPPPVQFSSSSTQLPRVSDVVRDEARRVAGAGSAYQQAVNLQQWFRSGGGFQYSVDAPGRGPDDGGLTVMEAFLREKRGYCVHFASTMAVMARTLGIPARVAVGFLPGTPLGDGRWQVTYRDAHAWPELYFDTVGWVRFEPTPQVQAGGAPAWTVPLPDADPSAAPTPVPSASASLAPTDRPADAREGLAATSTLTRVLEAVPWRLVAVLVGLALVSILPRVTSRVRRWSRWRSARSRSDRAEAAWDELRARCGDHAVVWPRSLTPRAVREHLVVTYELAVPADEALKRLVAELEAARYAPPGGRGGPRQETLRGDVQTVVEGIAARVPASARRRATWLPVTALHGVEGPPATAGAPNPGVRTTPSRERERV